MAVIGGGDVAIDAARMALRLGAKEVSIVYRRTKEEMPANDEEIEEAEDEKIKILYLLAPTRILTENGQVKGMECVRMELGDYDESGRRRPVPVKGSEFIWRWIRSSRRSATSRISPVSDRKKDLKSPKPERSLPIRSLWQPIFPGSLPEAMWSPDLPPSLRPWPMVTGQPSPSTGT